MRYGKHGSNLILGLICGALWLLAGCVPTTPPNVVFNKSGNYAANLLTAKDNSIYAVGTTWIDSGTPNGTVPVMLVSKFSAYGTLVWQKQFPENPSSEWLTKYAGLAKRDFDLSSAYSVSESTTGDIYVTGAAIADAQILATKAQHDPAQRTHNVYLLKYDTSGNLIWSRDIGNASYSGALNSQFIGTLEVVKVQSRDNKIYARNMLYNANGEYVKTVDIPDVGVVIHDLKAVVAPNCTGSSHASASCGDIEGYLIGTYSYVSDQKSPPVQVAVPGTKPVGYSSSENSLAILVQTLISIPGTYPRDYGYSIEQYDYANGNLVAKAPLLIESVLGVNFSDGAANGLKLIGISGNFYLFNYLADENKLLVAKLGEDQSVKWSRKYDATGVDQTAGDAKSFRTYIEEDGNLVVIFISKNHNIFRIAPDGTLVSHDDLNLATALPYYTSAANGDYIGFYGADPDLSKAFVRLIDLATP